MRLLIMGPPGAGKGTQAAVIAERFAVPAISTGDIFRENVAQQTALGVAAQTYMDAGEYVPDEITNAMVADRLAERDCAGGFLLDGYPRTRSRSPSSTRYSSSPASGSTRWCCSRRTPTSW